MNFPSEIQKTSNKKCSKINSLLVDDTSNKFLSDFIDNEKNKINPKLKSNEVNQNSESKTINSETKNHEIYKICINRKKKNDKYDYPNYVLPVRDLIDKAAVYNYKDDSWTGLSQDIRNFRILKYPVMAFMTGRASGILVLDIDILKEKDILLGKKDAFEIYQNLLNEHNNGLQLITPTVRTPSGGLHLYFVYNERIKSRIKLNNCTMDIRSDDAYIISPPSKNYKWIMSPEITELMEMPPWLESFILGYNDTKNNKKSNTKINNNTSDQTPNKKDDLIRLYDEPTLRQYLSKLDKKYSDDGEELWPKIGMMLKSENLYDVFEEFSKKSVKYNHDKNLKIWKSWKPTKLRLEHLNGIFSENGMKPIIRVTKKENFFTGKVDEQVNKQHIDIEHFKTFDKIALLIISGTGTGKSSNTAKLIKLWSKDNKIKLLDLISRVNLGYQHKKDLKDYAEIDIDIYKDYENDNDGLNKCKNLSLQVDSLPKLHLSNWDNNILNLDEVNSMISHIIQSSTMNKKRTKCFIKLCKLIKKAKYIIGGDADMSDMVIKLFDLLNISTYIYKNDYKSYDNKNAYQYEDKYYLIEYLKDQIKKNVPSLLCFFDTKAEEKYIVKILIEYCKENNLTEQLAKFIVHSSSEGKDSNFRNVKLYSAGKYVFCTPKVIYGLDFADKVPANVYLFSKGTSINAHQLQQQISKKSIT